MSTPLSELHVRAIALVFLCLGAAGPSVAESATLRADPRIVEVTVYRDRAEVVKEATVLLSPGANAVEFANLPFGVEQDTLRVSAVGIPATLGAIKVRERADEPQETPEWVTAQLEVRRIEAEIAALTQEAGVGSELRTFLKSVGKVTAANQARDLGEGRGDPAAIGAVYRLLEMKLGVLGQATVDRKTKRRELKEELALAQAKLDTLRPSGAIRSRSVIVEVEAQDAGSLTLRLAYVAPGASWRPSYRATLDAATGDVALISEGVVRQSTGEDWTAVQLRLSTASPSLGVEPPMLQPWILRPIVVFSRAEGGFVKASRSAEADQERFMQNVLVVAPGVAHGDGAAQEPAAQAQAQIVRSAYNVAFSVPGATNVPADGSEHRVVLRQETLAANLVHRTVPGLEDRAYLTAVMTSPGDYPLLAGPVQVFAGGAYLGSFPLKETGPGVELTLPFGIDNRIEIVRVPEPQMTGRGGITGKYRVVKRVHRTLIHNLLDHEATLVLEERLPVSEDERITVELGKETTPGFKDSPRRPGVKLWTLTLAAGEKREMRFEYSVRYPKGLNLPDLER